MPIDGKSVKSSYERSKKQSEKASGECLVESASTDVGVTVKVENKSCGDHGDSSLARTARHLLGCIITIDAMGTQTAIAGQIVNKGVIPHDSSNINPLKHYQLGKSVQCEASRLSERRCPVVGVTMCSLREYP